MVDLPERAISSEVITCTGWVPSVSERAMLEPVTTTVLRLVGLWASPWGTSCAQALPATAYATATANK